ncbi:MAG: 3-oxoacyl-ACP synthase, partial [Ottowia sp.]|nr:3-oxoacyl-ACP synthase [Ottowia sp.]
MSEVPYLEAWVEGVGVIGPGLTGWEQARAVLAGEAPYEAAPTALPAPELLPPAERRRASRIVKATLAA